MSQNNNLWATIYLSLQLAEVPGLQKAVGKILKARIQSIAWNPDERRYKCIVVYTGDDMAEQDFAYLLGQLSVDSSG